MNPLPESGRGPESIVPESVHQRTLSRNQRLTRSGDISAAYEQGRRWVGRYMVLWRREAPDATLRLGVVSSRKVGGAVQRNRARRKLREAWRVNRAQFSGPYDIVIVARGSVVWADQAEVVAELLRLAQLAGLMPKKGSE